MLKLLIASNNPGKLREIYALLVGLDLDLYTPVEFGLELNVQESGETYTENATIKGATYARATGLLTLSDDSGLEVDVLGGLPGLRSARFAPIEDATDADRRRYLLERLQGKPRPWLARFCCVVALVTSNGETHCAEGICEGEIIAEERGQNGFGYDPIFLIPALGQTMAELSMEEKNRISHRAKAIRSVLAVLIEKLTNSS